MYKVIADSDFFGQRQKWERGHSVLNTVRGYLDNSQEFPGNFGRTKKDVKFSNISWEILRILLFSRILGNYFVRVLRSASFNPAHFQIEISDINLKCHFFNSKWQTPLPIFRLEGKTYPFSDKNCQVRSLPIFRAKIVQRPHPHIPVNYPRDQRFPVGHSIKNLFGNP